MLRVYYGLRLYSRWRDLTERAPHVKPSGSRPQLSLGARFGIILLGAMQIAPGVGAEDWKRLDFNTPEAWPRAPEIFERRIRGRFTDVVDLLIADDNPRDAPSSDSAIRVRFG